MKTVFKVSEGIPLEKAPVQLKNGTLTRFFHPATGTSKNIGVSLLVMNPGDEVAPHYHKDREEIYFILSGEGIAIHKEKGKEEKIKYEKDLLIYIPPYVIHDIKVTGQESLWILIIFAPPLPVDDQHLL